MNLIPFSKYNKIITKIAKLDLKANSSLAKSLFEHEAVYGK